MTLRQLDGIFGVGRSRGWQGTTWSTAVARSAKDNIRTWGQLELTGEWADKPFRAARCARSDRLADLNKLSEGLHADFRSSS